MKIGIVIINFNGNADTLECLESLKILNSNNNHSISIYLIDNNSISPITVRELENFHLDITYLKSLRNEGFAEGNNIGINSACQNKCDYIVLLNNDTIIIDNSLFNLIGKMEDDKTVGIGGIVNYYFDNKSKVWQAGLVNDFIYGKTISIKKFDFNSPELRFVDYVPGSSIVIKKEVFKKIGLLDSRYFAYFEENDFCIRAKNEEYRVGFLQNSKILHKVGKSSDSKIKIYLRTRNLLLFYSSYANIKVTYFVLIIHVLKTLIKIIKSPKNLFAHLSALVKGINDFHKKKFYEGSINEL